MRWPLIFFIACRYLRAQKRSGFASFISVVSVVGIALGVMVLITVLSVFNGFNQVIKQQLFSMVPHITLTGYDNRLQNWPSLIKTVQQTPAVTAVSPYVQGQALLSTGEASAPALIQGVALHSINRLMPLSQMMIAGHLSALKTQRFAIVLGAGLAAHLGIGLGAKVNVFTPTVNVSPVGVSPRFRQMTVVGVYHSETGFAFDNTLAFMNLQDAAHLYGLGNTITGLHIDVRNLFQTAPVIDALNQATKGRYDLSDWAEQYGAFYHTIQIQKTMMFLIMLLIIAVAVFNLVASLVMLVNEKQADIAILRTLGMTPKMVMSVFVTQGVLIALVGIVIGAIAGIVLSLNITAVVNGIEALFHVQLLSASVNFVNYLPSKLQFADILKVSLIALILSVIATLYPARCAAKTNVVEALRHE